MKGCFENIDAAIDYIKWFAFDEPNIKVKLYCEAGCWYVEGYGGTVCNQPPVGWYCTRVVGYGGTVCNQPPVGWYCTRVVGHEGPCAALPIKEYQ